MNLQHKGSFGLVTYRRKVALLLRDNDARISSPNQWNLIGGLADEGESPRLTFIREAQEEINARSNAVVELPVFEHEGELIGVFWMDLNEDEFNALRLGDEGQRFEFKNFNEALKLSLTKTTRAFFELNAELIRQYVD